MICEPLEHFRYTGNLAETMKLISWLLDRNFWFEVRLASDFEEGFPEWEVLCGQSEETARAALAEGQDK